MTRVGYAGICAAVTLLAGCGKAQPSIGTPVTIPEGRANPAEAAGGIYVGQSSGGGFLFGFPANNRHNKAPTCDVEVSDSQADIAVDPKGNVIAADGTNEIVFVYAGPGMCGAKIGEFDTSGIAVDVASNDATNGKIIVGDSVSYSPLRPGSIQICTLSAGCATTLTNPNIGELYGVALAKNGDCWASAVGPGSVATLTYFKGCSGSGQSATGFENERPGGLDIDNHGNLVSVDLGQGFFVYGGCKPACALLGGPFPYEGGTQYGHLNQDSTAFVGADWEYGQADVYAYSPTKITYRYSFNSGLNKEFDVTGAAYNPRSKE